MTEKILVEDKQSDHPIWVNRSFDEVMWNRVDSKDVLDWFKRCIEEAPTEYNSEYLDNVIDWHNWFERWFSQFKETDL